MGASGSGKSTLMNVLGCLDRPTTGSYRARRARGLASRREPAREVRNTTLGFVFQSFNLLAAHQRLRERRASARLCRGALGESGASARAARAGAGRARRPSRPPARPSSPVASSSAWPSPARSSTNRSVIFADEPTGNLDSKTSVEVMALFQELWQRRAHDRLRDPRAGRRALRLAHHRRCTRRAASVADRAAARAPGDRRPPEGGMNLGQTSVPSRSRALLRNKMRSLPHGARRSSSASRRSSRWWPSARARRRACRASSRRWARTCSSCSPGSTTSRRRVAAALAAMPTLTWDDLEGHAHAGAARSRRPRPRR